MPTLPFTTAVDSPTATLRERADAFFNSCTRFPTGTDATRLKEWRRGRRDLSFEMVENGLLRGGKRSLARAIYLQKAAELIDTDADVPPVEDCYREVIETDVEGDRARSLALLDGQLTDDECRHLETTLGEEQSALAKLCERLRRVRSSFRVAPQQVGARTW